MSAGGDMIKSRISEAFEITQEMREWANKKTPRLDIDYHTEEFVDHWLGTGQAKANWHATWRNWMRRTFEGVFKPPRLLPVNRQSNSQNVHEIALQRSARQHGIDPTGMTDSQINNAIWAKQQGKAG